MRLPCTLLTNEVSLSVPEDYWPPDSPWRRYKNLLLTRRLVKRRPKWIDIRAGIAEARLPEYRRKAQPGFMYWAAGGRRVVVEAH